MNKKLRNSLIALAVLIGIGNYILNKITTYLLSPLARKV